jgi:uncharacterized protein (DUF2132 family)
MSETPADVTPATSPTEAAAPSNPGSRDPLHGVTLEMMLTRLVERHGWEAMGRAVEIRCFLENPSIASSLKFLRRTPWAREKVERMYLTNDLRPAWRRRGRGVGPRGQGPAR